MKKLSLVLCLSVLYLVAGCGKKEEPPAPAPQPQVQAPVVKPDTTPKVVTPAPAPEPKPEPTPTFKSVPGNFTVQVAAWETRENAEKLADFYNRKGYEARVEDADIASGRWYRVRIGSYDNSGDAHEVAEQIREKYKSDIWLVKL